MASVIKLKTALGQDTHKKNKIVLPSADEAEGNTGSKRIKFELAETGVRTKNNVTEMTDTGGYSKKLEPKTTFKTPLQRVKINVLPTADTDYEESLNYSKNVSKFGDFDSAYNKLKNKSDYTVSDKQYITSAINSLSDIRDNAATESERKYAEEYIHLYKNLTGSTTVTAADVLKDTQAYGAMNENQVTALTDKFDKADQMYKALSVRGNLSNTDKTKASQVMTELKQYMTGDKNTTEYKMAKAYYDQFNALATSGSKIGVAAGTFMTGFAAGIGQSELIAGAGTALGDIVSGGEVSDQMQEISNISDDNVRKILLLSQSGTEAARKINALKGTAINISDTTLKTWKLGHQTDVSNEAVYKMNDNVDSKKAQKIGQVSGMIGDQLGRMALGATLPSAAESSGGLIGSMLERKTTKEILLSALKGNATTGIMFGEVAGGKLTDLAEQNGYDPKNYANAVGSGFLEYFTENLFGFSDFASAKAIFTPTTGNYVTTVLKYIGSYLTGTVEEGLEEAVNDPLQNMLDWATLYGGETDIDDGQILYGGKKLIGSGGIFDIEQMTKDGMTGAAMGALLGTLGGIATIAESVQTTKNFRQAAQQLNTVNENLAQKLPKLDPNKASEETIKAYITNLVSAVEKQNGEENVTLANTTDPTTEQARSINALSQIAKKYDLKVVVTDTMQGIAGAYEPGSNRIVLALDAKNNLTRTAGHEAYHQIEATNAEAAKELNTAVITHLKQNGEYEALRAKYESRYSANEIDSEIVADKMMEVFSSEKLVKKIAQSDKGIIETAKDALKDFLSTALKINKTAQLTTETDSLKAVYKKMQSALKESGTANATGIRKSMDEEDLANLMQDENEPGQSESYQEYTEDLNNKSDVKYEDQKEAVPEEYIEKLVDDKNAPKKKTSRGEYLANLAQDQNDPSSSQYTEKLADVKNEPEYRGKEKGYVVPETTAEPETQTAIQPPEDIEEIFKEAERMRYDPEKHSEYDVMEAYKALGDPQNQQQIDAYYAISTDPKAIKKTIKQKAEETRSALARALIDSGDSVTQIGKIVKDNKLYPYYNQARASSQAAAYQIINAQTDIYGTKVGESLESIFRPIIKKGNDYYTEFQLYMFHVHNVDRMSRTNTEAIATAKKALNDFYDENPDMARLTEDEKAENAALGDESAQENLKLINELNKAKREKNKPIFENENTGKVVSAKESQDEISTMLLRHAEFPELAEKVYNYIENLNQYRVDSGLITAKERDNLKSIYPHYVPTYRQIEEILINNSDKKKQRVGSTVKRATGGIKQLKPLHISIGEQTVTVVRNAAINQFGNRLFDSASEIIDSGEAGIQNAKIERDRAEKKPGGATKEEIDAIYERLNQSPEKQLYNKIKKYVYSIKETDKALPDELAYDIDELRTEQNSNIFMIRRDGKNYEMQIDKSLLAGVQALRQTTEDRNIVTNILSTSVDIFKKLVTGYNPTFAVRNFARDLQDAGLYSRNTVEFVKNYPLAIAEIAKNGKYWQIYQALGGVHSTIFDYRTKTVKALKVTNLDRAIETAKKYTIGKVEDANMAIEQAPRLAEFMAVLKKSGHETHENLTDAMYAAAEITTNFGRSGWLTKALNTYLIPFANPGMQGLDKFVRTLTTNNKTVKSWITLAAKAAAFGILPAIINNLLYKDDEDYKYIRDSDKDTYYLIRVGNGMFLKIPKGRALSIFGMPINRINDLLQGEKPEWITILTTGMTQVAPSDPFTNNILTAALETKLFSKQNPGETWYGTDIESERLQGYIVSQRYDTSTDELSKLIGNWLNLSPKKINYLLNQYSGVVGDVILPLMTPAAESGMFASSFLLDAKTVNAVTEDFYDVLDRLEQTGDENDAVEVVVRRYWNTQKTIVNDYYTEIRDIETSDLSDSKKKIMTRDINILINGVQKAALGNLEQYTQIVKDNYARSNADDTYLLANYKMFGAKYALEIYSGKEYDKAKELNKTGMSYEAYFETMTEIDKKGAKGTDEDLIVYRGIVNSVKDPDKQMDALKITMSEDNYIKLSAAYESDVTPTEYIAYREILRETAGEGAISQEEATTALNKLPYDNNTKAVLWQLANLGWTYTNNPYSTNAGRALREEMGYYDKDSGTGESTGGEKGSSVSISIG